MFLVGHIIATASILDSTFERVEDGWKNGQTLIKSGSPELKRETNKNWSVFGVDRSELVAIGDLIPRSQRIIY